jgi:adenylosuccinate synthase
MVKAIVGANWGDEGKGKITDMFAEKSDVVIRFQGGANAGHTIINDYGKFALHTLPSGVFFSSHHQYCGKRRGAKYPHVHRGDQFPAGTRCPEALVIISERAQVMMPYHVLLDTYEEARLSDKAFGSTKSGIGPFYSDKFAKIGFQVCELFDDGVLRERLEKVCTLKNALLEHLYRQPLLDADTLYHEMVRQRELIRPYVGDAVEFVQTALKDGKTVLLEGQLGT